MRRQLSSGIRNAGPYIKSVFKRAENGAEMAKKPTNETMERLTAYWQLHRQFDANIADLARYARVSRDTVYRWLNSKAQPREQKLKLIQEWLDRKQLNPPN